MSALASSGRDLYLKYQGPKSMSIVCHRVWDAHTFFQVQQAMGMKDENEIVLVTLVTPQEYKAYKGYRA